MRLRMARRIVLRLIKGGLAHSRWSEYMPRIADTIYNLTESEEFSISKGLGREVLIDWLWLVVVHILWR